MKLSIIMPVFNAGKTLERTLLSLKGQLQSRVELIVVDDGSTDSTTEILSSFAREAGDAYHVIKQDNAGAASARNTALNYAKGDYLAFVDADDCLCADAISTILRETESGADVVGWDWQNENSGKTRRFYQPAYSSPSEALKCLMGGTMKWNLWLFAVKRSLVIKNGIRFLDGADMGEDMAFMLKCFACANDVRQIHEVLYCYNESNPSSISQQLNERRRGEVSRNLDSAEKFLMGTDLADICRQFLPHLKLFIKLPLLIGQSKDNYLLWYAWFSEANAFACKNDALPLRTRALQWLASKKMWNGVKFYNVLYNTAIKMKYNSHSGA